MTTLTIHAVDRKPREMDDDDFDGPFDEEVEALRMFFGCEPGADRKGGNAGRLDYHFVRERKDDVEGE